MPTTTVTYVLVVQGSIEEHEISFLSLNVTICKGLLYKVNRYGKPQAALTSYFRLICNKGTHESLFLSFMWSAFLKPWLLCYNVWFLTIYSLALNSRVLVYCNRFVHSVNYIKIYLISWFRFHVIPWAYKTLRVFFPIFIWRILMSTT